MLWSGFLPKQLVWACLATRPTDGVEPVDFRIAPLKASALGIFETEIETWKSPAFRSLPSAHFIGHSLTGA
jgi:hypothetical protein